MFIILIENYKRKAVTLFSSLLVLILVISSTYYLILNTLAYNVEIDNTISFSYPVKLKLNNIFVSRYFDEPSIRTGMIFNSPNRKNLVKYISKEGNFQFDYPSIFYLSQQQFTGSEILYHIDLKHKAKNIRGLIQVWKMPYSLKKFLDTSKSTSLQNFKYFSSKPIIKDNTSGFLWDYAITTDKGEEYKAMEVFFKKNNKMYRISYFVPNNLWNKEQSNIFWGIVNSFKTIS